MKQYTHKLTCKCGTVQCQTGTDVDLKEFAEIICRVCKEKKQASEIREVK
jgi:hypothetical protein